MRRILVSKNMPLSCILAVGDLYYILPSVNEKDYFIEEVKEWFAINDIRATPKFNLIGKSKYSQNFDYGASIKNKG
jgi:hypothetical protein